MEKSPVKQTVFFIVILVASANCMITSVNVIEGDLAFLNFTYSCNSTEVTIQRGNGAPFYNPRSPTPPSSSNVKLKNGTNGKVCFLYVTINPVTRDDQGGYILTAYMAYKDDPTQVEDERILLLVSYPPGIASCSFIEEYIDQDWVRLRCTAPIGTIGGYIMCYQKGIEIPPLNSPQEHDETLSQTLIARLGDLVYCCSSTLDQTKDRCECKDFVWDPIQKKQVTNVTDPCPPTVPMQYSTFTRKPAEDEYEFTSPFTKTSTDIPLYITSGKALVIGIVVVSCLLIMVMVIFIVVMMYTYSKKPQKKWFMPTRPESHETETL